MMGQRYGYEWWDGDDDYKDAGLWKPMHRSTKKWFQVRNFKLIGDDVFIKFLNGASTTVPEHRVFETDHSHSKNVRVYMRLEDFDYYYKFATHRENDQPTNPTEEVTTMSNPINQAINAMHTSDVVEVKYTDTSTSKTYHYKSPYPKGFIKEGDLVLVRTPQDEIKELKVLKILPATSLDLNASYRYKFILGLSQFPEHNAAVLREQLLADTLQQKQRETLVNRLMAELGVDLTAIEAPQS